MPDFSPNIPIEVTVATGDIPLQATVSDQIKEETDFPVKFSFKDYNQKECQIHKFSRDKDVRQVTGELRTASRITVSEFKKTLKPITNAGAYSVFFNGLEKDAELWEIVCAGTKRVFGYLTLGIFNIVAITSSHVEVGKNRG